MYDILFILFKFCLDGTTNVMPFCLPANVYIESICIIAGTLSMFSARGCVPDIRPGSVWRNTVPREVSPRTLPREQGVYWIILSLWIISFDIITVASEYQKIHPYSAMNIGSVKINTSLIMMKE